MKSDKMIAKTFEDAIMHITYAMSGMTVHVKFTVTVGVSSYTKNNTSVLITKQVSDEFMDYLFDIYQIALNAMNPKSFEIDRENKRIRIVGFIGESTLSIYTPDEWKEHGYADVEAEINWTANQDMICT